MAKCVDNFPFMTLLITMHQKKNWDFFDLRESNKQNYHKIFGIITVNIKKTFI